MLKNHSTEHHYHLIEKSINYLLENYSEQPDLKELAQHAGLSEFYFQRLFVDWVGISPKRFLQFLTREHMKVLLDRGYSTTDAAYQVGLSGSGRSHELFVKSEAITPSQYKKLGKNLEIYYGFHSSPFGEYLLAITHKGICHISFIEHSKEDTEASFKEEWLLANLRHSHERTIDSHKQLFSSDSSQAIKLLLRGTPFQIQIWQALLSIPFGAVSNYEKIATAIGRRSATRATASAIAQNKIAYLIPCHRVIRKVGESGDFRWGKSRKKILLAYESALTNNK